MDEDVDPHNVRDLTLEFDDETILNSYLEIQSEMSEKYYLNIKKMYGMVSPLELNFAVFAWGHLDGKNRIEPSHFTMDIFDGDANFRIYVSHAEKGQHLIQFGTILNKLEKNKGRLKISGQLIRNKSDSGSIHDWPGSAIFFGSILTTPSSLLMTILRWWFYYDKIAKLGNYPSSCSGSVGTVLWNHCAFMRSVLSQKFFYQKHLYGQMNDLKFYDCPSDTVINVDLIDDRKEEEIPKQKRERRATRR